MITTSDAFTTVDCGEYYAILPVHGDYIERYLEMGAKMVETGFSYNSGQNKYFLTVDEMRILIQAHVDPSFSV
nr:hypothetical protein [Pseudanabaena sp. lw0831]